MRFPSSPTATGLPASFVEGLTTRTASWLLFAAVPAASLAACQDPEACALNVVPGVEVEVRDGVTGELLTTAPRGVAREGAFQDSLRVGSTTLELPPRVMTLIGADERTGRYVVQVEADGYQAWDTAGIQVTAGECHVQTVRFTAALDPAP